MRRLAQFEEVSAAQQLGDALFAQDIDNDVTQERGGGYAVWVHRDEQLEAARLLMAQVSQEAAKPQLRQLQAEAEAKRKRLRKAQKGSRHREVDVRTKLWGRGGSTPHVSWGLIAVCVLVAVLTNLGDKREVVIYLLIGDPLLAIQAGEPWRLITPIFLHFGLMHLFFNMWWMSDLGPAIERWKGALYLLALVLTSGLLSNLAQFYFGGSPFFGGMSGVVYALLAFVWVRGRFDPNAPVRLPRQIAIFMLGWMALGFVGLFNMANYAHLGGLVVGLVWGYLSSGDLRRRLRR